MQYFLDISLVALIVLTVVWYWRRGLVKSLMGAAKTVLSIILTYMFGDAAADWLHQTYLQPAVRSFVHTRLEQAAATNGTHYDLATLLEQMPQWLQNLLELFHVDVLALQSRYSSVAEGSAQQLEEMAIHIATPITAFLSTVIGYAAVFLLSGLVLTIVAYLLGKLAELPVIRGCDRAMGLVLGVLCAVLFSSLYVLLVYLLLGWWEVNHPEISFSEGYDRSLIFRNMYQYNLFKLLFGL